MPYEPISNWRKREVKLSENGYVLIKVPEHPRARNGWIFEHTLVAESEYGLLEKWETVHHINETKTDNRLENLFVCARDQHDHAHGMTTITYRKIHNGQKGKPCLGCGRVFYGKPHAVKRRKYCSSACRRKTA